MVPPFLLWLKFKVVSGVRRVLRPRVNIAMLPHISQHRASIVPVPPSERERVRLVKSTVMSGSTLSFLSLTESLLG